MKRTGCLLSLAALLGLAVFLFWKGRTPPAVVSVSSVPLSQLPPQKQQERRRDAQKLTDQVSKLARSAKRREHKKFTITATQDQLNTLLQDRLKTEKFAIHNLSVGLGPDTLKLQGKVPYRGVEVTATLSGNIRVTKGKLDYELQSLLLTMPLGTVNAPQKWKDKVQREVTRGLNALLDRAPGRIDKATIEQGEMTIEGETN